MLKTAKFLLLYSAVYLFILLSINNLGFNIVVAQEATESGTFDLNPSQKDPAEYNILPLILDPNLGNSTYEKLLFNMLSDQGYEAHCAQKEWLIDVNAWGDIVDYFAEFPNTPRHFSGISPQYVNLESARIPLLRGMEDGELTDKNDSFEGMFGANLHKVFTELDYVNATGVAGRLLSSYWQCFYKKNNLDVIEDLCSRFFINCFLNKEVEIEANPSLNIPSARLDYLRIKERLDALHPEMANASRVERNSAICIDLYPENEGTGQSTNETIALNRAAIEKVKLDLDNLYRLAFLVLVPRQTPNNNKLEFLQSTDGIRDKDAPIFIAFKIPEFATNKSRSIGSVDSLELTKLVLQDHQQNIIDMEEQDGQRAWLTEAANQANSWPESTKTIQCAGMPQCERSNDNILENALVDIINATQPLCHTDSISIIELENPDENLSIEDVVNTNDLHFEKAGDLFTPIAKYFDDSARNPYKNNPLDNQLLDHLDSKTETNFSWNITVTSPSVDVGEKVSVKAYLVLPMGETVKDVNKSFAVFWNRDVLFELVKTNVLVDMDDETGAIPKYYTIKNSNVGFSDSDNYSWETNCRYEPDPSGAIDDYGNPILIRVCDQKTFGVTTSGKPDDPLLFPDFGLGWFIRKIQSTIRSTADDAYKYVASCQRVEDLFLGRCAGRFPGELESVCEGEAFSKITGLPDYSDIPAIAQNNFITHVTPKVSTELMDIYGEVEATTGIPCEIVAGVHFMEGGMSSNQSLLDGGALRGTLLEDAILAMEHLKDKMGIKGLPADQVQLDYQTLLMGLARYNGPGNGNCTANYLGQERPTRWREAGKCPISMEGDDHIYPVNWIDEKHQEMDLIFCMDTVEFTCNRASTSADEVSIKDRYEAVMGRPPTNEFVQKALEVCFMGGGSVCADNSHEYPLFQRLGVLTTAMLLYNSR